MRRQSVYWEGGCRVLGGQPTLDWLEAIQIVLLLSESCIERVWARAKTRRGQVVPTRDETSDEFA